MVSEVSVYYSEEDMVEQSILHHSSQEAERRYRKETGHMVVLKSMPQRRTSSNGAPFPLIMPSCYESIKGLIH
jgi:hypothetical protein